MTWRDLIALPRRVAEIHTTQKEIHTMAGQTTAALAELSSAIDEVAGELDALAAKLDEAISNDDAIDEATAGQIRAAAERLRGLRPDDVQPEPEPEPGPALTE